MFIFSAVHQILTQLKVLPAMIQFTFPIKRHVQYQKSQFDSIALDCNRERQWAYIILIACGAAWLKQNVEMCVGGGNLPILLISRTLFSFRRIWCFLSNINVFADDDKNCCVTHLIIVKITVNFHKVRLVDASAERWADIHFTTRRLN